MTQLDAITGAPASPAKTECEDDQFDTYWNNRVGEHEVWVPYYEDYVQFWKLGDVITDEDGRDWVLDRHREVYVPIPRATAAWLRIIRKARYGEQEAGKKASMSPETEWGTPPPDELVYERFQAWTESPVAAPTNVSTHTSAASAAVEHCYDDGELEYSEGESRADYSSDELQYAGDSGDSYGDYAQRTGDDPKYSGSDYSDDESDYVENECDQAGEEGGAGYVSSAQGCTTEDDEHVAPRTVTYEFHIKVEDEDDDYALLHPGSPRPDAAVDALTEQISYLSLPDNDVCATGNDSA